MRARPGADLAEAAEIQGYDAEVWEAEALPLRQVLDEMSELLPKDKKVVPAGQNVRMDVNFLERGTAPARSPTRSTTT